MLDYKKLDISFSEEEIMKNAVDSETFCYLGKNNYEKSNDFAKEVWRMANRTRSSLWGKVVGNEE